ncbi:MAG TPA: hypothetical protein VNY09_07375 [Candidatus Sulfotelmatobacter sp.]|nr:hypothetical protein [Candidatus Sulfotelmatobacter sp.]
MKMLRMNICSGLAFALLVSLAAPMLPSRAFAQSAPIALRHENDADSTFGDRPEREQYDSRAFPATDIAPAQQAASYKAFLAISQLVSGTGSAWVGIGPTIPFVDPTVTYTGRATYDSGRVTSLAISPRCGEETCVLFVGAAGGGIWKTDNALATNLNWQPSSNGIPSNSIGVVMFDTTDRSGKTLYVGTGEPNGSSDSEAGVGLFKSTDLGQTWSLVPGSVTVAAGRSIAAVAVDPLNPKHLFIGTAVARHGSSSVNGGRFTPPGAPVVGLYESNDGGATFTLAFSLPSDPVDPNSPNGSDFFRGGVSKLVFDRTGADEDSPSTLYFSVFDYGLYRSNGAGSYEQIFASAGLGGVPTSLSARTEFALAPHHGALRIYVGDDGAGPADFYRVDNALVPAVTLTDGTNNPGWIKLSNSTPGTPGFAMYDFCGAAVLGLNQCSYDMFVASPPGHPDTVWVGGQIQYGELAVFLFPQISNGRAVQRSTDAGASFTDMTNDLQSPPLGMHPDQHAIVFVPGKPDVAIVGSDGGVIRTSGAFGDGSATCNGQGLVDPQLTQCQQWLSVIPTQLVSMNQGLATLQFQSLSIDARDPLGDLLGGTQDNGTWTFSANNDGSNGSWAETIGGDGGQSGTDVGNSSIKMHMYTGSTGDVNFNNSDPLKWDLITFPQIVSGEAFSFYAPLINDPRVSGTWFVGGEHVWRTLDNGGPEAYLDQFCNELLPAVTPPCGDWEALGGTAGDLITGPDTDKGTGYVAAIVRAPSNTGTMWVATRRGRLFISKNSDNPTAANVTFTRLDTPSQPERFISGIAVDRRNSNHAWVSFSGYNAYTPTTPGHVFEVRVHEGDDDEGGATATWTDLSYNLGDQPITGIARDDQTGDLYVATDFGVDMLPSGSHTWVTAGTSLPPVAIYGLAIDSSARVLYAATHGRSAWKLSLP